MKTSKTSPSPQSNRVTKIPEVLFFYVTACFPVHLKLKLTAYEEKASKYYLVTRTSNCGSGPQVPLVMGCLNDFAVSMCKLM